jgi:hypothetical protein
MCGDTDGNNYMKMAFTRTTMRYRALCTRPSDETERSSPSELFENHAAHNRERILYRNGNDKNHMGFI